MLMRLPLSLTLATVLLCVQFTSAKTVVSESSYPSLPPIAVESVSQKMSENGIMVTYKFANSVTAYSGSKLFYVISTGASSLSGQRAYANPTPDNQSLIFNIGKDELTNAERLEFQVKLINPSGTVVFISKTTSLDLTFVKTLLVLKEDSNGVNDKLKNALEEKKRFADDLLTATKKAEALQTSLNTITEGLEPKDPVILQEQKLLTDEKIVLLFSTGRVPCRIRVTARGTDGGVKTSESENIGTLHVVELSGLNQATPYTISAVALRLGTNEEIPETRSKDDPRLSIKTKDFIPPPVASFDVIERNADSIKINVNSNQNAFVEITYRPIGSDQKPNDAKAETIGSIQRGDYGTYSGNKTVTAGTPSTFTLPNLEENTEYEVTIKLLNSTGKNPTNELRKLPRTIVKPLPFDFAKAIVVNMSPVSIKVQWTSTVKAESAGLQAIFEGETPITIDAKPTIAENTITASIPATDVVTLILKNKVPTLRLTMTDAKGAMVQRDLQVSFIMPTKETVQQDVSLQPEAKAALLDVIDKITKKKGIDWSKVLQTGLSLVVKTFVPIP